MAPDVFGVTLWMNANDAFTILAADYGSFGLFVGASLEGEGVVMLGGIMSDQHAFGFGAIISLAFGLFPCDDYSCWDMGGAERDRCSALGECGGGRVLMMFNAYRTFSRSPCHSSSRTTHGRCGDHRHDQLSLAAPSILLNAISALIWSTAWVMLGSAARVRQSRHFLSG